MKLHKETRSYLAAATVMLFCGLALQSHADSSSGGVSYSPDHWPNRWSSAIRQQQNGQFPTREKPQTPPSRQQESVSEQDLFYLPSAKPSYEYDYRQNRFEDRLSHQRYMRDARRISRDAAYAYRDIYPMYPSAGFGAHYGGFPYGTAPLGIDPVLGHPGMGIPIMPGTPFGYPYGGAPGFGGWNPPFGAW